MSSSTAGKSVFFTGATGYIGGTVFQALLSTTTPPSSITFLVRDAKKGKQLEDLKLGGSFTAIKAVVGSFSDTELLAQQVADADVTVHCANADDMPAIQAIIQGMKTRREKTGHRPLLIHTSGTGVLADDAHGEYPTDKIYTDFAPTEATSTSPALLPIEALADDAPHRPVDLAIVDADAKGYLKSYIVIPSTIWGAGTGPLYEAGLSNSFSDQIPRLCKIALDRGEAGHIGKGANIWNHISLEDLATLYATVYEGALKGDIGYGKEGYYFGAVGEYTWRSAAEAIGAALRDNGWAKEGSSQPTRLSDEEAERYYGAAGPVHSGNSRARGVRASSIGFKPKYPDAEDMFRHAKQELVRIEKEFGKTFKK